MIIASPEIKCLALMLFCVITDSKTPITAQTAIAVMPFHHSSSMFVDISAAIEPMVIPIT